MSPQRGCRGPACSSPLKQVSIVSNTQRRGFTHNSDFANLGVLSPARAEENLYPNHLTLAPPHAVPSGPSGGLSGAQRWAGTGSEAWHSPGQPLHAASVLGPEVWAPMELMLENRSEHALGASRLSREPARGLTRRPVARGQERALASGWDSTADSPPLSTECSSTIRVT